MITSCFAQRVPILGAPGAVSRGCGVVENGDGNNTGDPWRGSGGTVPRVLAEQCNSEREQAVRRPERDTESG